MAGAHFKERPEKRTVHPSSVHHCRDTATCLTFPLVVYLNLFLSHHLEDGCFPKDTLNSLSLIRASSFLLLEQIKAPAVGFRL